MPVFKIDSEGHVGGTEWADLSPFVRGYIEAMFFTNEATGIPMAEWWDEETQDDLREGRTDGVLPCDVGFSDLHPDSLAIIHSDCHDFERTAAKWLSMARARGYDRERAGNDFWYTRNSHGVGFWDRDVLDADGVGEALTAIAQEFGEVNPWFAGHVTYGDAPFVHVG